jgi:hypothetical protein
VVQGAYGFRCQHHVPTAPGEYVLGRCVIIRCRCGHKHVIVDDGAVQAAEQLQELGTPCQGCRHITKSRSRNRIVLARAGLRR